MRYLVAGDKESGKTTFMHQIQGYFSAKKANSESSVPNEPPGINFVK